MATASDYLKLVKPAVGEKYTVAILNDNSDKIDAGVELALTATSLGKVLRKTKPQHDDAGLTLGNAISASVPVVEGRLYKITYRLKHRIAATDASITMMSVVGGAIDDTAGDSIETYLVRTSNTSSFRLAFEGTSEYTAVSTGEVIMKLFAQKSIAPAALFSLLDITMLVEDIGLA